MKTKLLIMAFLKDLTPEVVCYMRHVVQSHVLWSVDYESLFGIWGSGCWKFSKTGFYPGGGGGLTVLWAGLVGGGVESGGGLDMLS